LGGCKHLFKSLEIAQMIATYCRFIDTGMVGHVEANWDVILFHFQDLPHIGGFDHRRNYNELPLTSKLM
jgi:hypothetical protein